MLAAGTIEAVYKLQAELNATALLNGIVDLGPLIHRCLGCLHTLLRNTEKDPSQINALCAKVAKADLVSTIGQYLTQDQCSKLLVCIV